MLSFSRLQLEIELSDDRAPAGFWGSRLRGGFGSLLKLGLCDHPEVERCRDCPRVESCDYPALFKPVCPAGQKLERPLGGEQLPPPFVLDAPIVTSRECRQGSRLQFGLVLIGARMLDRYAYPIRAFEAFGQQGVIGKGEFRSRFRLINVADLLQGRQSIYTRGELVPPHPMKITEFIKTQPAIGREATVQFLTRTCILQKVASRKDPLNNQVIIATFYELVLNLINRIGGLHQLYGEGWIGPRAFLKKRDEFLRLAKSVRTMEDSLSMEYEKHYSETRQQYEPLDGFRGSIRFVGDLEPFAELLRLGEILHIGQQTSYGLGQYRLLTE